MKRKANKTGAQLVLQTLEVRDKKLAKVLGRSVLVGQVLEFAGPAEGGRHATIRKAASLLAANQAFLEKNVCVRARIITEAEAEEFIRDGRELEKKEKLRRSHAKQSG